MTRLLISGLVLAALTVLSTACGEEAPGKAATSTSSAAPDRAAVAAAESFLRSYVDGDGRVVRHDQGGDTVSEGQGYAMLLADAVGDEATFTRVWTWTRQHLQQHSGLFASRWADGAIRDADPAADADTQIAWALSLAAARFHHPAWAGTARRIARSIADHEVGYDDAGRPLLAAGPWAVTSDSPPIAEPGYWTPPAADALAALTADHRWRAMRTSQAVHLRALTHDGAQLPSDWAAIGGGRPPTPIAAPQGNAPIQGRAGRHACAGVEFVQPGRTRPADSLVAPRRRHRGRGTDDSHHRRAAQLG